MKRRVKFPKLPVLAYTRSINPTLKGTLAANKVKVIVMLKIFFPDQQTHITLSLNAIAMLVVNLFCMSQVTVLRQIEQRSSQT